MAIFLSNSGVIDDVDYGTMRFYVIMGYILNWNDLKAFFQANYKIKGVLHVDSMFDNN